MNILQKEIADEMSQRARIKAALFMVRDLPTEDIEIVNEHFPHLADSARHEILNPELTGQESGLERQP
jgi:hypothetical protein